MERPVSVDALVERVLALDGAYRGRETLAHAVSPSGPARAALPSSPRVSASQPYDASAPVALRYSTNPHASYDPHADGLYIPRFQGTKTFLGHPRSDVLGFTFPWTGERYVRSGLPPELHLETDAHEAGHIMLYRVLGHHHENDNRRMILAWLGDRAPFHVRNGFVPESEPHRDFDGSVVRSA